MALLDTPQAMYGNMTSQYQQLMQHPYGRPPAYHPYYEQEAALAARFNIQRLQPASTSPEFPQRASGLKEEAVGPITVIPASSSSSSGSTAFRPYSSPGQENLPHHHHSTHFQAKVLTRALTVPGLRWTSRGHCTSIRALS